MKTTLLLLSISSILTALPENFQVMSGQAKVGLESDSKMLVQVGHTAELNWNDFSIREHETVQFVQPSTESCVTNRVVGNNPSHIFGTLKANGKVILINPNSIIFGKDSQIDVGALTASSLDKINETYKGNGFIRNHGSIRSSGPIFLLGQRVENSGSIRTSEMAKVTIFAGQEWHSDTTFSKGNGLLESSGAIKAGEIELFSDENILLYGNLTAPRVMIHTVDTVDLLGNISAPSGDIQFYANSVRLFDQSLIDVSGEFGGGTVVLGDGESVEWVHMAPNATIKASALKSGDGGKVTLFGSKGVNFCGEIHGTGGPFGGDGGEVEISTNEFLNFKGKALLSATDGLNGTLLIDPTDVIISNITTPGVVLGDPTTLPLLTPVNIDIDQIITNLNIPSNITITTASRLGAPGDITLSSSPTLAAWSGPGNLTLIADRDILINAAIKWNGEGDLRLDAVRNIEFNAELKNTSTTVGQAGDFTALAREGNISVNSVIIGSYLGEVYLEALRDSISINAVRSAAVVGFGEGAGFPTALGNITVKAARDIRILGGVGQPPAMITKAGPGNPGQRSVGSIQTPSNISVVAGRNLEILDRVAAYVGIGNIMNLSGGVSYIGDITVDVGNDCILLGGRRTAGIGVAVQADQVGVRTKITYNIGRDFLVGHEPGVAGSGGGFLGVISNPAFNSTNITATIYANIGRNFILDSQLGESRCSLTNSGLNADFPPEMVIHVGNDLIVRGSDQSNGAVFEYITPQGAKSQYWAGGSIYAINGERGGGHLHVSNSAATPKDIGLISVRSNGDIKVAGGARSATNTSVIDYYSSGGITYNSDFAFSSGQLWPSQQAFVGGINIFVGTALGSPSPQFLSNDLGGVAFDHNFYQINAQPNIIDLATSGVAGITPLIQVATGALITYSALNGSSISISSRPEFLDGATANILNIGTLASSNMITFSNQLPPSPPPSGFSGTGADISLEGWHNLAISGDQPATTPAISAPSGDVFILSENNIALSDNAKVSASGNVVIVSDHQAPSPPLVGPGIFAIDGTSSISSGASGYIRVYTATQAQNDVNPSAQFIDGGVPFFFVPGTIFVDTDTEKWSTYFSNGDQGFPFKIFYKPTEQLLAQQAEIIIDESFSLLSCDQLGWWIRFNIEWDSNRGTALSSTTDPVEKEPFFIRKVQTPRFVNHPKSYTSYFWR